MKALGMAQPTDSSDAPSREMPLAETGDLDDQPSDMHEQTIPIETQMMMESDTELIELPPIAQREVSGSSSLMHCVVGGSTLLFGGVIDVPSSKFDPDSLNSLPADNDSAAFSTTSSENLKGQRHHRESSGESSKRGVKGPTQLRGSSTPNGSARRVDSRSCEFLRPTTDGARRDCRSHAEVDYGQSELQGSVDAVFSSPPVIEELPTREPFVDVSGGSIVCAKGPFADDSAGSISPKSIVDPSAGSPTTATGSNKQSKSKFPKFKLSLTKNGKSASVVPLFDDNPQTNTFDSVMPGSLGSGSIVGAPSPGAGSLSPVGVKTTNSTRSAGPSIDLGRVAGNSLFKRRQPRVGAED
jgi:hypothetical protein